MLKLCGFAASNYYNKVKLALLEKQLAFDEELIWPGKHNHLHSPLGKVPYLETDSGGLCESTVILEYLEARYPEHPLLPADPFAAAKVRELVRFSEMHLELVARNLYPEAFFGGKVSDSVKDRFGEQLQKNVTAFAQLVKFSPFIAGDSFTLADCAAAVHLPMVSGATKLIYGRDFLADLPVKDYLKHINARPAVVQVNQDRKVNMEAFLGYVKARSSASR
jgi:glutathione S-transferase